MKTRSFDLKLQGITPLVMNSNASLLTGGTDKGRDKAAYEGNNIVDASSCFADNGVADYLPFVFPSKRGLIMVLAGYFDESERTVADDPICVAGYVFKPSGYDRFRRRFRHALRIGSRRQRAFHMTDLYAGHQEYKGISIADRITLLDHAVGAITSYAYLGVAVYFNRKEFEAIAPPDWPLRYGSIYTAACQMCIHATANLLKTDRRCHLPVLYVFESGHKYQNEVHVMLTEMMRGNDANRKLCSYKRHMFEEKQREYGLQAADLLAWMVTKLKCGDAPSLAPWKPSLFALEGTDEHRCFIMELTGDNLRRFLTNAMASWPTTPRVDLGPRKRAFR
jgi:hypothetical protein